ncbi:MAG: hypothetical protein JO261_03095 [Alphaproteobacteria bacterium]|nr:hypothetical protein [Alphaproteobacteria bacterium]MBV9692666.1 hypothetical protein [Alphaproteobacteria bacterium]
MKTSLLVCLFVVAATPAFADFSSCSEPYAPASLDGNTATMEQMQQGQKDVVQFIKDSDTYQDCMNGQLKDMQREAARSKDKKPVDPSIVAMVQSKIDKNQKLKEKVGAEFNTAAQTYNAKHPK